MSFNQIYDLPPATNLSFLQRLGPMKTQDVMQTPVQDTNGEWYVSQASMQADGAESVMITRLDQFGGFISYMHCDHAGHGTVIGLEREGSTLWVWMYWSGLGLCRVRWRDNVTQTFSDTVNVQKMNLSGYCVPILDVANDIIVTRTTVGSGTANVETYRKRKLSEVKAGKDIVYGIPVGPLSISDDPSVGGHIMQGAAVKGDTLLVHSGRGDETDPWAVRVYSFVTGKLVKEVFLKGKIAPGRRAGTPAEPEGIGFLARPGFTDVCYVGYSVGERFERMNMVYAFDGDLRGPQLERQALMEQFNPDGTSFTIATGTANLRKIKKPGQYYATAAVMGAISDGPLGRPASGMYLVVGAYDASGSSGTQTLYRNTVANTPQVWTRVVNYDLDDATSWREVTTVDA